MEFTAGTFKVESLGMLARALQRRQLAPHARAARVSKRFQKSLGTLSGPLSGEQALDLRSFRFGFGGIAGRRRRESNA